MNDGKLKRFAVRLLYALAFAGCVGLIVASQTGCGGPSTGAQNQNPVLKSCQVDEDCESSEELCSAYLVCMPRATGGVALGFELTPPVQGTQGGMKLTQTEVPPWEVDYGSDGVVSIGYQEAVRLTGSVMVMVTDNPDIPLQATITATRDSRLPGRPKVVLSKSVDALGIMYRPEPTEEATSFTMMLPKGVRHTLRATPLSPFDQVYHPTTMDFEIEADTPMTFVFGEADNTDYLTGVVVDAVGAPVFGVKVRAVDEGNGIFVSTVDETDETGSFRLAVPRGLRTYKLTFSPSETNQNVPQVTHNQVECCNHDGNSVDTPEDLGEFMLPAFPMPQTYQFKITGLESSGHLAEGIEGTLTFETEVGQPGGVTGVFTATASVDASGKVTVDLIPGDTSENRVYKVTVITPPSCEFASEVREEFEVGPLGGVGESIELTRRVPFVGSVQGNSPTLEAIRVQARRAGDVEAFVGQLLGTDTAQDGRFNLLLDPGFYAIELLPPTGVPLPRWAINVGRKVELLDDETVWNAGVIAIPDAAVLEARIRSTNTSGTLLEGVKVSVYMFDDDCSFPDAGPCGFPPILLGEATTNSGGLVRLIVPRS
ncbi:MAG: carboxypeptidase-like regulatory domain-containing protein [bacterium]